MRYSKMKIGFSTGSLAKSDFRHAIELLKHSKANVIELSALRETELEDLINSLSKLDLSHFDYVSFHAPSKIQNYSEKQLVKELLRVKQMGMKIVLHPDVIIDFKYWQVFEDALCIE